MSKALLGRGGSAMANVKAPLEEETEEEGGHDGGKAAPSRAPPASSAPMHHGEEGTDIMGGSAEPGGDGKPASWHRQYGARKWGDDNPLRLAAEEAARRKAAADELAARGPTITQKVCSWSAPHFGAEVSRAIDHPSLTR